MVVFGQVQSLPLGILCPLNGLFFSSLQDYISLRGEVYFPNLAFEKMTIDFGCVLNDTEVTRYVNVTNNR